MTDLDPKTFNLLDTLQGRTYPEDEVVVYTDVKAFYEYQRIDQLANDAGTGDEANEYDAQLDELRERIKASGLTVSMRGYAPAVNKSLTAEARAKFKLDSSVMIDQDADAFNWLNKRSIAEAIVKVTDVHGNSDERLFTVEDVDAFEDYLTPEEFSKIVTKTFELSWQSMHLDNAVNADF